MNTVRLMVAAFAAIILAMGYSVMANDTGNPRPLANDLLGDWQLVSAEGCEDVFPGHMEFRGFGVYVTADGVEKGARWHGGDWELEDAVLKIQASNDEMLSYNVAEWNGRTLRLEGMGSCDIRYARDTD